MFSFRSIAVLLAMLQAAGAACAANIYLDEDFEGPAIFADRNWPTRNTTAPLTLPLMQGINLRSNGDSAAKISIAPNEGAAVSDRAYLGAKSYRLASGQFLGSAPGAFANRDVAGFRLWQFALGAGSLGSLAPGAEAGRFQIEFSTNGADLAPEKTVLLLLVADGAGGAELVCANNGDRLGSLSGQSADWLLVSVVANTNLTPELNDLIGNWRAYDPVTDAFKGPDFLMPTGVHIYAKSKGDVKRTSLLRSGDLGPAWGNCLNVSSKTNEIGWKFQALNGGALYIDNLYWDCGEHASETGGMATEQAARMERAVGVLFAGLFTDNAVLQRDSRVPVWGTADPGAKAVVELDGVRASAVADARGRWKTLLPTGPAGGPFDLRLAGGGEILRRNILLGDVWLCSGQSNMAFKLIEAENAEQEIAAANYPDIRLFEVPWTPAENLLENPANSRWELCDPDSATSFSAVAYFFGRDLYTSMTGQVPVGLIQSCVGATRAEDWTSLEALQADPEFAPLIGTDAAFGVSKATYLYNGMIHPLIPFALSGAVWYQGEANANGVQRALAYRRLLPLMINDWRAHWGAEFPFLIAQLPSYAPGTNWPELRESQLLTLASTRATGMAVTLDTSDPSNLHPIQKQPVGYRLARFALGKFGGQPLVYSGPLYRSQTIEAAGIRVSFDHVGAGLVDANGGALQGFQIAGANKSFVAANALIEGATVFVSAPSVASPQFVRYAWAPNPLADLFNSDGLPASPFRTDPPPDPGGATPTPYPTPAPTATPTPQPNRAAGWGAY